MGCQLPRQPESRGGRLSSTSSSMSRALLLTSGWRALGSLASRSLVVPASLQPASCSALSAERMHQPAERLSPVPTSLVNSRGISTSAVRRSDEEKAAEEKAAAEAAAKAAAEKAAAEKAAAEKAEAAAIANMRDPIQELFLTSIRAYGSSGGLASADSAAQDALKAELERVARQYGIEAGEDVTAFPSFEFSDKPVDPINISQ